MDKLEAMRYAGKINLAAIERGFEVAKPGVPLYEVDAAIDEFIRANNCTPAFKGYRGFPGSVCLSPNDTVVHGVPDKYILGDEDILTVDLGTEHEGWMVDAARTRHVGTETYEGTKLINAVEAVLASQLEVVKAGASLLEIALAAEEEAQRQCVSLFVELGGHQIGRTVHEDPFIPSNGIDRRQRLKADVERRKYARVKLKDGQTICLEPVATFGKTDMILMDDGWTIKASSRVAHTERCLVVTHDGYELLS